MNSQLPSWLRRMDGERGGGEEGKERGVRRGGGEREGGEEGGGKGGRWCG